MKPLDPRLLRYASAARGFLAVGSLLGVLQTLCIVAFAWLLTGVITGALAGRGIRELAWPIVGLCLVIALRAILIWLLEVLSVRSATAVKSQLRMRVLKTVRDLGPGWLAARSSTSIATVAGPGLDALDNYFAKYLPQLILTALATPILVVVLFSQDLLSGVIVLLTLPIIPVFMVLIGWATETVQKRQWRMLTTLASGFLEVVGGLATLKIFGRQNRQAEFITRVTDDYRAQTMKVLRVSFLSGFVLELVASLSVALVAVSIGLRMLGGGLGLTVGLFVLLLTPEAYLPLRQVGVHFHAAADGIAAADDVFEILDAAGSPRIERSGRIPPEPGAALELLDLEIAYDGQPVISGLDARFDPGTVSVIAGASGSGKSTLAAALLGFVPHTGAIRFGAVGAAGGVSRSAIAWAGQRPGLVSGTVGENVSLGSAAPQPKLVARALELAAADDIDPDAELGVAGAGLSGGQAQRVAIARAYYRALEWDCPVILLDEPSSALDSRTERGVIEGVRALAAAGRIVIVVSHRPAVIASADQVLRLAQLLRVR
ncbi:MAG: thiol reductant ABC exporter subunit CydD [Lacisediminihabitans sp.]